MCRQMQIYVQVDTPFHMFKLYLRITFPTFVRLPWLLLYRELSMEW